MRLKILVLVAVVAAAGCSASASPTTTVAATTVPIEFGAGEVPATVPADFPMPDGAVVGTTLVDRVNGATEMVVTVPGSVPDTAAFYESRLAAAGFEVAESSGTKAEWRVRFSRDDVSGEIFLTAEGSRLSAAVVRLDHAG